MRPLPRSGRLACLGGGELPEYAAGRLAPQRRAAWDRHLVSCAACRAAVQEERRLQAALAEGPRLPGELRGALLALAARPEPQPEVFAFPGPTVPLATLAPSAPPVHRSVLRSAVVAAAVAGASAAAAWSLGLAGGSTGVGPRPATLVAPTTSPGGGARGIGPGTSLIGFTDPTVENRRSGRAESTP